MVRKLLAAGWLFLLLGLIALQPDLMEAEASGKMPPQVASVRRIDINIASAEEIATIPGLGVKKSEAVVLYRKIHGPFRKVEELKNVDGIGDKLLERIRPYIMVGKEVDDSDK